MQRQTHTHTHTHTHSVTRDTQGGWSLGQGSDSTLTHEGVPPTPIRLVGYEHQEDAVGGGGSMHCQTHTHTQTHTHSVTCDTQEGWSLGQGSDAVLTHVSMAHPLIQLMGYEHREHAVGCGGCRQGQTYTHTHTVSPVIHRVDGVSCKDRMKS